LHVEKAISSNKDAEGNTILSSVDELRAIYTELQKVRPGSNDAAYLAVPQRTPAQDFQAIFGQEPYVVRLVPVAYTSPGFEFLTSHKRIAQAFHDILRACMWLHGRMFVHKDVVSRNILKRICEPNFVLTDFECAGFYGEKAKPLPVQRQRDDIPARFKEKDCDQKWYPADDMEQLCVFIKSGLNKEKPHTKNDFSSAVPDALEKLDNCISMARKSNAKGILMGCDAVKEKLASCFSEKSNPFLNPKPLGG
jgi:hypothetical protein